MENKEYYNELAKQRDLEITAREKQEQRQGLARASAYYTIPVTYNKQAYKNFCGPAYQIYILDIYWNCNRYY